MNDSVTDRLRKGFSTYTRAEKSIATYLLANLRTVPFETATSIARQVGVSPMTVGRFLRTLGYARLSDLKQDMRAQVDQSRVLLGDRLQRLRTDSDGGRELAGNLELEVESLLGVYELVGTPAWRRIVAHLVRAEAVYLAGFQTVSGLAADFAARLEYARDRVHIMTGANATFAELFANEDTPSCLVLIEMRRYSKASHLLAVRAKASGVPIVIVCDTHCYWAYDYSEDVLAVSTASVLFWDSQAAIVSLLNLLLNDVIRVRGPRVEARVQVMQDLQATFQALED